MADQSAGLMHEDWLRWLRALKARVETPVSINAEQIVGGGQPLTGVSDSNVTLALGGTPATALLKATSVTVGWTGTLAAARLNANVVQAVTNDTNVTGSIAAQGLTMGWAGTLAPVRGGLGFDASGMAAGGLLVGTGAGTIGMAAVGNVAGWLHNDGAGALAWTTPAATSFLTADNPFGGFVYDETPAGAINGVNAVFTTTLPYASLQVFLNGVRQKKTSDYTETTATTFTCVTAPLTGDALIVDYRGGSVFELVFDSFGDVIAA